jgi:hypothetical protein
VGAASQCPAIALTTAIALNRAHLQIWRRRWWAVLRQLTFQRGERVANRAQLSLEVMRDVCRRDTRAPSQGASVIELSLEFDAALTTIRSKRA